VAAEAATVFLKDGSRVSGTVVSATARDLQVHTPDGLLTITTDRILRVDYSDSEGKFSAPAATPRPVPLAFAPEPVERRLWSERRQQFSLGLGFDAPLSRVDLRSTGGGTDSNGSTGLILSSQYLYHLTSRLAMGAQTEFLNRSGTNSQSLLPESNTDVFGNTFLFLGTLRYSFTDRGYARPYLLGGLGANQTSTTIEATPNVGFAWSDTDTAETRTLVDESHWGFASTVRFGVEFALMDPGLFSLEVGWTRLSNPTYGATQAGRDLGLDHVTGNQNVLAFAARWGWRF
jgi:opacity protein-like surface antigen